MPLSPAAAHAELTRRRKAHPLAYARLWEPRCHACRAVLVYVGGVSWACLRCGSEPAERTSQQRTLADFMGSAALIGVVCGGNRSGKTVIGAQWTVASALGRDHPDVVQWGQANGLDLSSISTGPGVMWADALTFPDSRRYVRTNLRKYVPEDTVYRNWFAENEAEALLPNGGKIVCKAITQRREGHQGDAIRGAWIDEEPADAEDVVGEITVRLADEDGRLLCTYTPLSGYTWLYHRWVEQSSPDVVVRHLWGEDKPHVRAEVLDSIL